MKLSIQESEKENLLNQLGEANKRFQKIYPGDKPDRQAVHTVYGGANLFKSDTCKKMGEVALNGAEDLCSEFLLHLLKFCSCMVMNTCRTCRGILTI